MLQLPRDVRPLHYGLSMEIVPQRDRFRGTADIEIELDGSRRVVWLHGRGLTVTSAWADAGGQKVPAAWEQVTDQGVARLRLEREIGPGKATLHLAWDAPWSSSGTSLYLAHSGSDTYAATQFEAIDARGAFPGFDEPGFKTPYDVTLTVPAGQVAVGNTPIVEQTPLPDGLSRVRLATTRPLPTYLLAWAVGPFDVVEARPLPPNEVRSRPLQVRGLAPRGRGKELAFALASGAELLVALERYFGIPFPYEKLDHIAVPESFGGAMENAGAIVYLDRWLLFDEAAGEEDSKIEIASTMTHEMAHQWFGDLVTLGWWTEIWLNESFAVWMTSKVMQQWRPEYGIQARETKRTDEAKATDSLAHPRAIRQPLETTEEIGDQFDDLTYLKGGAVLGMFERWVGPAPFRTAVHDYLVAHADGVGSTQDFMAALVKASGRDPAPAFYTFLDQGAVPTVDVRPVCGAAPAAIQLTQSRYRPTGSEADPNRTWQIPFCARWGEGGQVRDGCTLLTEASGSLPILGGRCPEWVMPNADAAGYYNWTLGAPELSSLLKRGYAKLSVPERISLAQNLRTAIRSGAISFADGMGALETVARDPDGDVATEAMSTVQLARDSLVPDGLEGRVQEYGSGLYGAAMKRVGWAARPGETRATRAYRSALASFLVFVARDKDARREAAKLGRAYLGAGDNRFHPEAVSPDLAGTVLAAAVREGDKAVFDAVETRLGSIEESQMRRRLIDALAATTDPALSARAAALSTDARLRKHERLWPLFAQAEQKETREAVWQLVQRQFDSLVRELNPWQASFLPSLAEGFCDGARAQEVEAFFKPRLSQIPGARRVLDQTVEKIRLCAAVKNAQEQSARAFFEKGGTRK